VAAEETRTLVALADSRRSEDPVAQNQKVAAPDRVASTLARAVEVLKLGEAVEW
jgi:hypothetical protein